MEQQYAGAAHKAEQTMLTAPIDGTVQGLTVHTVVGVVTPAEQLMQVVLEGGPLLVEAMVGTAMWGSYIQVRPWLWRWRRSNSRNTGCYRGMWWM